MIRGCGRLSFILASSPELRSVKDNYCGILLLYTAFLKSDLLVDFIN